MKRFSILLLTALLALSAAACQQEATSSSAEDTTVAALTEPTTQPDDPETSVYVIPAREETYTDKSGGETVYRIPKLNSKTEGAQAINAAVNAKYDAICEAAAQGKQSYDAIDYQAYVNDDIVTLLITAEGKNHAITYDVYNYNKTTGKQLDNAGLLDYLWLEEEPTYKALQQALEDDYTSKFRFEDFPDDYYYQMELSVGDEAVAQSTLFLNENAARYALCTEYAGVGAKEFQVLIAVN